jgi:erythromycin esterase-like protein
LIGMGTNSGTVAAASDWDGPLEIKQVREGRAGSIEALCHEAGTSPFLLDFARHPELSRRLAREHLERFIGVIYRPETELQSHYSEAKLSRQYDAWIWFDRTEAVQELGFGVASGGVPDTFPFGV